MAAASRKLTTRPASQLPPFPGFPTHGPSRERKYDIILDGDGYVVARDKAGTPLWTETPFATELGGEVPEGDAQEKITTCHMGYGYSESFVPGCYDYAIDMDASLPGVITMGPLVTNITGGFTTTVTDIFEIGGRLVALGGRYAKIIASNDSISTSKDFGAGVIPTKAALFGTAAYIGFSSGSDPIWSFTGATDTTTWANTDSDTGIATVVQAKYWAKDWLNTYGWRLWRGYSTNSLAGVPTTSDPLRAGQWGSVLTIGDASAAITGMVGMRQGIWVAKSDGLYAMDASGMATNLMKNMETLTATTNGVNPVVIGSSIIIPHLTGLLEFDPRTAGRNLRSIQPGGETGNTSPVYGRVTAQVSLGHWHYAALYNGTDTYIMKGRRPRDGETLPPGFIGGYIWHPIVKLASKTVNAMWVTNLFTATRLYFGVSAGSTHDVSYIRITPTGNHLADSNMTYAASGSFYFSPIVFGADGTPKELLEFDIENEGFSATTYAKLYVALDGGSYSQWGFAAITPGRTRLTLPTGTWRTYRTRMRLDVTNASSTTTPKIKPVLARAALRPVIQDVVKFRVLASDDIRLRDGGDSRRTTAKTDLQALKALLNTSPVSLTDYWFGRSQSRNVIVTGATPVMIEQDGDTPAAWGIEVSARVLGNIGTYFKWDGQSTWNGNYKWT